MPAVFLPTALLISFAGATGNMNNSVRSAVADVMQEQAIVTTISGSGMTKLRVDGLSRPFTNNDLTAIAQSVSTKTGCKAPSEATDTRQARTKELVFTCPRR